MVTSGSNVNRHKSGQQRTGSGRNPSGKPNVRSLIVGHNTLKVNVVERSTPKMAAVDVADVTLFIDTPKAKKALTGKGKSSNMTLNHILAHPYKPGVYTGVALKEAAMGITRAVAEPAVAPDAYEPNARARAILRGRQLAEQDLRESGGTYDLEEVRTLLGGISRQAVAKRVDEGSLLAVEGPERARRYPTVQFTNSGDIIPGLKEVLRTLPSKNPWVRLNFLVAPEARLGGRKPIDLMREGKIDDVLVAARTYYEQGAR
jgi:hypothetical protein